MAGNDLRISLDMEIQQYAEQLAYQTLEKKKREKSIHHRDEPAKWGDLCYGQCAGV